jgi:preprotein translocase subunit SecG
MTVSPLMSVLLGILTVILILVSFFLILVILMQKSSDAGVGTAMGGGMAEATFGAQTSNVLTKATINAAIVFFVLSIALFLGRIYQHNHAARAHVLPVIPATPAPATPPLPVPNAATAPQAAAPRAPSAVAPQVPQANGAKPAPANGGTSSH